MPYVQRDQESNRIIGVFANPQPGFAEEFMTQEDIDAEMATYPPPPIPYVPKCIISVVDENGDVLPEAGDVEIVAVVKQDGSHSVRARNVSDNGDGTWTIGDFL